MISKALIALTLCVFIQVSFQTILIDETVPPALTAAMAERTMRYHHFLWHNLRENWLNLDASTQHAIASLGWAPPRPASYWRAASDEQIVLEDNDSGEDFLYMHRQMIVTANRIVAGTEYEKVKGWKECPAPGDPRWPVPPAYEIEGDAWFSATIAETKSEDFYWNTIVPMEEALDDEENLRKWTLGQLGAKVEFTVHKWMHLRFSELESIGIRPTPSNPTPSIENKWNDPEYRWLGDTYSSHVNSVFWKIHGWVDDKIEKWRKANGLETITWKGTWESGPMNHWEDLFEAGAVVDSDTDTDVDPPGDGEYQPNEETLTAMARVVHIMLRLDADNYFRNTNTTSPNP